MARIFRNFTISVTPDKTVNTLLQFLPGSNQRVVVPMISVMPKGNVGASLPIVFKFVRQDDSGNMPAADGGNLKLVSPVAAEAPIMTAKKWAGSQTEPTTTTDVGYTFTVHQQQNKEWIPTNAFREVWMLGGEIWGLVYTYAGPHVALEINIPLEE